MLVLHAGSLSGSSTYLCNIPATLVLMNETVEEERRQTHAGNLFVECRLIKQTHAGNLYPYLPKLV